jgi:cytochrome c peroxidase
MFFSNIKHTVKNKKCWSSLLTILSLSMSWSIAKAEITVLQSSSKLSLKAQLGQKLFFDTNLSTPPGQSCASCHDPKTAFTDPDKNLPTSQGVLPQLKGGRNTPTALYAAFTPRFGCETQKDNTLFCTGGLFLDGRAATLEDQAKGPFLNPLEMANPNPATVVNKVKKANYAKLFERVYGKMAFDNIHTAYNNTAEAIATFERTPLFRPFTSKYDYFLAGKAKFTDQEKRGRVLFEEPDKGNCAACHPSRPAEDGTPPLFTDFSYDNLGVPQNPDNPFYQLPHQLNLEGSHFIDLGLGKFVNDTGQNGKFKVPTLRNIAVTAPYTHNGYFKTLRGVVEFYSNRDIKSVCKKQKVTETTALKQNCWPTPEVRDNMNFEELGEINLSNQEINDIVAFLRTLTDNYKPN